MSSSLSAHSRIPPSSPPRSASSLSISDWCKPSATRVALSSRYREEKEWVATPVLVTWPYNTLPKYLTRARLDSWGVTKGLFSVPPFREREQASNVLSFGEREQALNVGQKKEQESDVKSVGVWRGSVHVSTKIMSHPWRWITQRRKSNRPNFLMTTGIWK